MAVLSNLLFKIDNKTVCEKAQIRTIKDNSDLEFNSNGLFRRPTQTRIRFVVCDVCGSALKFELHPDPFQNVCGSEIPYY